MVLSILTYDQIIFIQLREDDDDAAVFQNRAGYGGATRRVSAPPGAPRRPINGHASHRRLENQKFVDAAASGSGSPSPPPGDFERDSPVDVSSTSEAGSAGAGAGSSRALSPAPAPAPRNPQLVERWSSEEMRHIQCHLETKELWDKFNELGTEMIITKTGSSKSRASVSERCPSAENLYEGMNYATRLVLAKPYVISTKLRFQNIDLGFSFLKAIYGRKRKVNNSVKKTNGWHYGEELSEYVKVCNDKPRRPRRFEPSAGRRALLGSTIRAIMKTLSLGGRRAAGGGRRPYRARCKSAATRRS